jgi:predicted RNA-binding protein with RPS1 domain
MKVILKQSGHGWIDLRIEFSEVCITIETSSSFDPYERLYIWLGKIRDSQLPEKMVIDEEGYSVELIVEEAKNDVVVFRVDPWFRKEGWRVISAMEIIDRRELIKAFHDGITEFIANQFIPSDWSYLDYLSYQNWGALINANLRLQNWNKRLLVADYKKFPRENITEEDPLTTEQESILSLRGVLERIAIANRDFSVEIQDFANLYKKLPEDIILNEIDFDWYQEHRLKLNIKHDRSWGAIRKKSNRSLNLCKFRLESLKLGQIIDGTIVGIKHYGVFVDIGGCYGLLHNSEISQLEIEHPSQIFTEKDWVRVIIIDLDIDRGRVTLSTRILESEAGDMHKEPWKVYERAEEMADRYRQNVLSKIDDVD